MTEHSFIASQLQPEAFQRLISEVPVGITIFRGPDFLVEIANDTYLRLVDRSAADFIGRPLFVGLPEVREAVEPLLKNVYETGIPYKGYEFPVILNRYGKSETSYFNFVYQAAKNEAGEINGIIVVAIDVTESVTARQALEESEKQFRNMVMQSPIAMTIFKGPDHIIDMANINMYEKIWRKKPADVLGKPALEVFPELKAQKYPELLREVFVSGKTHRENESIAMVQGDDGLRKFYLDFEYAPLKNAAGEIWGIMITVYDATEKVEARQKVEEVVGELRLFKSIADNVTDFVGVYDMQGAPLYINQSGIDKMGFESFGQMQTVALWDYFFEEDRSFVQENFLPAVATAGAGEAEIRFRHYKTGEVFWMLFNVVYLIGTDNEPIGFATVSKDITVKKESINELELRVQERTGALQKMNRELERSNADLQQFAHVASHDLKEPVRKIKIFSLRLEEELSAGLPARAAGYLQKIIHSTNRIYSMIDGVLKYSSSTAGNEPPRAIDLNEVIDNIRTDLEIAIREKKARFQYQSLPQIQGYPHLVYQLFYNLINNALKFSQPGQPVEVRIDAKTVMHDDSQPFIDICVSDNGIGFDNEHAENIFHTFTRLHAKEMFEGTGLGLALCKKIVQQHHGYISAHGRPNEGASFTISLPVNPAP